MPELNNYIHKTKHAQVEALMKHFEIVKNFVETRSVIGPPKSLFDKLYFRCTKLNENFVDEVKSTGDVNQRSPKRSSGTKSHPDPKEADTERGQQPEGQNGSMVQQLGSARENPQIRKVSSRPSIRYQYGESHRQKSKPRFRRVWAGPRRRT